LTLVRQLEEVVEARLEAEKWARIGLQSKGSQLLRKGLTQAERANEPWKDQLVDHWREALEDFERRRGVEFARNQSFGWSAFDQR
jgi:hypothetical protein